MNVLSQKEAVFSFVTQVIGDFSGRVELTTDQRKQVIGMLVTGFSNSSIKLTEGKYSDAKALTQYADSLLSNWLRKDTRLNGGVPHAIKNPGSRAGSSDPQVKTLRDLKKTLTKEDEISEVEEAIAARLSDIKASKKKPVEINADLIPENLRHLISAQA